MPVYTNSDQLYNCFQLLVDRIEAQNKQATDAMLRSQLRFRFRFSQPTAELTIDARQRPLQIVYGPTPLRPDLDISLAGDTLHQILLGELTLKKAVGSRQLKPKGPVWKTAVLSDLFDQAKYIYPQLIQELRIAP